MIKYGGNYLIQWITKQFNFWIQNKQVPPCILRSQIWLIPKGVFDGNIKNTRPINLIEILRKIFSLIFSQRIYSKISSNGILKGTNYGFTPGYSTSDAIKLMQLIKDDAKDNGKIIIVAYLDVKKAYDSVHPNSIKCCLKKLKFDENYWHIMKNIFENRSMRVLTQAGVTNFFHPNTGLEQGDRSSPILWNIFYEPLLNELQNMNGYQICGENISYLAYADDLTLIASNDDDMEALLCKVNDYLKMHKMQLQPTKSIIYSNYIAKNFYIEDSNLQIQISNISSKQDLK